MRKGLKNLVAVAVALLGVNAMAMAPTISDIPSPIIADFDGVTAANDFTFPDAFSLATLAEDDFTSDGGLIWSYDTAGAALYSVNSADPLGGANPTLPGSAFRILENDDPAAVDANSDTVTLRDVEFSPEGGPNTEPGFVGVGKSQVVTFYVSDGSTYSFKSTIFYTDNNGGEDRFSGGFSVVDSFDFGTGALGWTYATSFGGLTGQQNANGLCITALLSDASIGGWRSDANAPYELVDNSVYKLRLLMSSTAGAGATPVIQYVVNNTAGTGAAVDPFGEGFAYGGEFFIVDAEGSANAIVNRTNGEYNWYFVPTQAQNSVWRSTSGGAFDAANDAVKDFRMEFNVFDVDGIANSAQAAGTICLSDLIIERAALNALSLGSADSASITDFDTTNFGIAGGLPTIIGTLSRAYSSGDLVVSSAAAQLALLNLEPGTDPFAPDAVHFPIALTANTAYMATTSVAGGAGSDPIEIFRINADLPTNEIIQNTYAAATLGSALGTAALPAPGGSAETYTAFFYSHNLTASGSLPQNARFSFTVAMRVDVNSGNAANANLTIDGLTITPLN